MTAFTLTDLIPLADREVLGPRPTSCDRLWVGLVLWTLLHTSEALAADGSAVAVAPGKPGFSEPNSIMSTPVLTIPIPDAYRPLDLAGGPGIPSHDFRPRPRSILACEPDEAAAGEPMMRVTTVWQRLSESRSHNRVSLVTLWETGGNSLSLQAGHRGDPSLQWTSRLTNRGSGPRGLLDELFSSATLGSAVRRSLHFAPRPTPTDSGLKTIKPVDNGYGSAGAGSAK